MAITKSGGYILLYYEAGDAKGDSESNPWTLDDILAVDTANGWGNITKNGDVYTIDGASIQLIGKTYFKIQGRDLQFLNVSGIYLILGQTTGLMYMEDCTVRYNGNRYIQFGYIAYISNCRFDRTYRIYAYGREDQPTIIKNTIFTGNPQIIYVNSTYTEWNQVDFIGATYGFTPYYNFKNDNVRFIGGNFAIYTYGLREDITIRNLKTIGTYYGVAYRTATAGKGLILVDCDVPPDKYTFVIITNIDQWADYRSTFNWLLGDSVHIKVYDKDDTLRLEKDVNNGDSDEITFSYHTMLADGDEWVINDLNHRQPFKVEVSKAGYDTLTIPDIEITLGQPTNIRGKLVETTPPVYVDNDMTVDIAKGIEVELKDGTSLTVEIN